MLDCETEIVSSITAYPAAYLDPEHKEYEKVVGMQTDKPLKRAFMPYGGIRMAQEAASTYGFHVNDKYTKIFNEYHKTHNQGVFDAYTDEMRVARRNHHYGSARHVRTRPHRGRLPPRSALRH